MIWITSETWKKSRESWQLAFWCITTI